MTKSITILRGSFGCPSGQHAGLDPYPDATDWHEAARGDGASYSGVLEVVEPLPEETPEAFEVRVSSRVDALDADLHCSRCYRD